MRTVLLGGTKGMGRALARELASRGHALFLLGRDLEDLRKSAQDLESRYPGQQPVGTGACDLKHPASFAAGLETACTHLGGLDTVIVTAGMFGKQEELEQDLEFTAELLTVNFTNTVLFCEAARSSLLADGGGTLCVFSSVAGERARKPVVLYGASKAGLSAYLEGLDHRFRDQGLITVNVKPGFVKTGMTAGLDPPPFAGEPEAVARQVARAIERGTPVVYAPPMWRLVMLVIRNLPRFVMRRIGF
jgi:decaprenylphospho-beta-D-erythro-pentofuranosid-2-ulose 2-reductase